MPVPRWRFGLPVVLAIIGLLFVTVAQTARGTDLRGDRTLKLADLIRDVQQRNDRAAAQVARLQAEVDALSEAQADVAEIAAEQEQARQMEGPAGLQPVTGPGLTVTLDDAPPDAINQTYRGVPQPVPDDLVVHQQDMEGVVNALWAAGSSAMQLMDQRVISTSAFRCVGNVLILQGRVYSPPYVVTAIGAPAGMKAALTASRAVQTYLEYADAYGLGWSVQEHTEVTVPAYAGSVELEYAQAQRG
ncbi:MAG: DUF881 domain-containing protein [Dehalococcoidia bacterium]